MNKDKLYASTVMIPNLIPPAIESLSREAALLSEVRIFVTLGPAEWTDLASMAHKRKFRKSETIYHQGDPAGGVFVVASGTVKTQVNSSIGKRITVAWVPTGSVFGTMSTFSSKTRAETAIALEACELLAFPRDEFRAYMLERPERMQALFEEGAERWSYALRRMADLTSLDVPERTVASLVSYARRVGEMQPDGSILIGNMTQAELSLLVGATRESVHSALRSLERQGLVEIEHRAIKVLDLERLTERLT